MYGIEYFIPIKKKLALVIFVYPGLVISVYFNMNFFEIKFHSYILLSSVLKLQIQIHSVQNLKYHFILVILVK